MRNNPDIRGTDELVHVIKMNDDHVVGTHIKYNGHHLNINRQEPASGTDAKGRQWESDVGWYFACHDCGNNGPVRDDAAVAIGDAIRHTKGHE